MSKRQVEETKPEDWKPARILPPPVNPVDVGRAPAPLPQIPAPGLPGFFLQEDQPLARRGFRYVTSVANPFLPSLLYTQCETEPYGAGVSSFDRSEYLGVAPDGTLSNTEGYRSARANVCITGGEWYYEVDIVRANEPTNDAHVRVGLSRREAGLEAPVGADAYGYGVGDLKGRLIHISRLSDFMEPFKTGDVLGFHVNIPRKSPVPSDIRRDRYPLRFKSNLYLEILDYVATKEMTDLQLPRANLVPNESDVIPGSFIKVYKNGQFMGTMVEGLREFLPPHSHYAKASHVPPLDDGMCGYYPTVSLYRGGQARFNFGPEFKHAAPDGARSLSERYDEQIADDVTLDILDNVDLEEIDAKASAANVAQVRTLEFSEEPEAVPAKVQNTTGSWSEPAPAPVGAMEVDTQSDLVPVAPVAEPVSEEAQEIIS